MIQVIQIEGELLRVNGDIFQELCNHLLYLKLNPNSITPYGSVIGKEKSRKGIPDSYFTCNDELIFAEFTTQERLENGQRFYDKLASDIDNCFDTSKTGLNKEDIDKVILCYNNRLKPSEIKDLNRLCKKHNPKCQLELKGIRDISFAILDYPILGSYLGINVGTGQIQTPSEFISKYENQKLSTPLSNPFVGRRNEITNGLNYLERNDLIIVNGDPGTGKSKFAIELAKCYSQENNYSFLCIGNTGIPIWEDLKSMIRKDQDYILLIDDANRISKNFQWILSLLDGRKNSLKVIVTVRNYALNQVKSIAERFEYSLIDIGPLSIEKMQDVLKSSGFEIHDQEVIEKIDSIAHGNARLSIMCAKVALEAKILHDVTQIYDEYFGSIFKEVEILKDPVAQKSLALISFFAIIDKNNDKVTNLIFSELELDESKFWEVCYALHESELVDLFEQQVVKISDQIFATYIFYKVVIESELLDFNFFLKHFLAYEYRISDTIIPIINSFNYKQVEEKLRPIILNRWSQIESEKNHAHCLSYLDLFWFYLGPQAFKYLRKRIDGQHQKTKVDYRYNYELNEFSNGTGKDFEILAKYRYHSDANFKDAVELMLYYAIRFPEKMPAFIYTLKERFTFSRYGYKESHRIQHLLLDFLIHGIQESQDKLIFENIFGAIVPKYLKIQFSQTERSGKGIKIYTFRITDSESIKLFRRKCFNFLLQGINKRLLLRVMHQLDFYEYKNSPEILEHDLEYIYQLVDTHLSPEEFEDCFILENLLEILRWLNIDYSKNIDGKFQSEPFKLAQILKIDIHKRREHGWEEEERMRKEELRDFCKNFGIQEYTKILDNVASILTGTGRMSTGNVEWQYISSINIIMENLAESNPTLFIDVIEINYLKFQLNINLSLTFSRYLKSFPENYYNLYKMVQRFDVNSQFCFHQVLDTTKIESDHLNTFYSGLLDSLRSIKTQFIFWDLTFVSKYTSAEKSEFKILTEVLEIIVDKNSKDNVKISVGQSFLEMCTTVEKVPLELVVKAYLISKSIENHFDYENKILEVLLTHDSNLIVYLLKFNSSTNVSFYDLDHENYDFIWELDNYLEIFNSIFEFFVTSENIYSPGSSVACFFSNKSESNSDIAIKYLQSTIDSKADNQKYMDITFSVISKKFPELLPEFVKRFLNINKDFNSFQRLEIVPRSRSWTGSFIPILEEEKSTWKRILIVLDQLQDRLNYLDHKEYVSRQIGNCDLRIKSEIKSEFYDDFMK
ncbi:MAG: ATP-binding protein [bacterium]|nr:ATP-binding protein [bacterium]